MALCSHSRLLNNGTSLLTLNLRTLHSCCGIGDKANRCSRLSRSGVGLWVSSLRSRRLGALRAAKIPADKLEIGGFLPLCFYSGNVRSSPTQPLRRLVPHGSYAAAARAIGIDP
jgi:hypothetical protein